MTIHYSERKVKEELMLLQTCVRLTTPSPPPPPLFRTVRLDLPCFGRLYFVRLFAFRPTPPPPFPHIHAPCMDRHRPRSSLTFDSCCAEHSRRNAHTFIHPYGCARGEITRRRPNKKNQFNLDSLLRVSHRNYAREHFFFDWIRFGY